MAQISTELTPQADGAPWLRRPLVHRLVLVLLAAEIAVFAFMIAGTHGWIVPLQTPTTTDFASFYAAGSLANAGTPQLAYDHAAHLAANRIVMDNDADSPAAQDLLSQFVETAKNQ